MYLAVDSGGNNLIVFEVYTPMKIIKILVEG